MFTPRWSEDRVDRVVSNLIAQQVAGGPRSTGVIVRILVSRILLWGALHPIQCYVVLFLRVAHHIVMRLRKMLGIALRTVLFLPNHRGDEINPPKNFIEQDAKVRHFIVIYADPDRTLFRQQLSENLQPVPNQ